MLGELTTKLDIKFKYPLFINAEFAFERINEIIEILNTCSSKCDLKFINELQDELNFIIQTLEGYQE